MTKWLIFPNPVTYVGTIQFCQQILAKLMSSIVGAVCEVDI